MRGRRWSARGRHKYANGKTRPRVKSLQDAEDSVEDSRAPKKRKTVKRDFRVRH